jgi:hypothetical protein
MTIKWEHRVALISWSSGATLTTELNDFGDDGWELAAFIPANDEYERAYAIFRRPLPAEPGYREAGGVRAATTRVSGAVEASSMGGWFSPWPCAAGRQNSRRPLGHYWDTDLRPAI